MDPVVKEAGGSSNVLGRGHGVIRSHRRSLPVRPPCFSSCSPSPANRPASGVRKKQRVATARAIRGSPTESLWKTGRGDDTRKGKDGGGPPTDGRSPAAVSTPAPPPSLLRRRFISFLYQMRKCGGRAAGAGSLRGEGKKCLPGGGVI